MSLAEFLDMGGYAAYLWPSFGLTIAVLIWNIYSARRAHAEARRAAARRLQNEENR